MESAHALPHPSARLPEILTFFCGHDNAAADACSRFSRSPCVALSQRVKSMYTPNTVAMRASPANTVPNPLPISFKIGIQRPNLFESCPQTHGPISPRRYRSDRGPRRARLMHRSKRDCTTMVRTLRLGDVGTGDEPHSPSTEGKGNGSLSRAESLERLSIGSQECCT